MRILDRRESSIHKMALIAGLILFCNSFSAAQAPAAKDSSIKESGKGREVKLDGLRVRLEKPIEVTKQIGWHMTGPDFDNWSFIHLTPMMARFPKGGLIVTYTLDSDTQHNPIFLSGFQISPDSGATWGTRYPLLMQHIPMIFIPEQPNSLVAVPSEFMGEKDGDNQNFRAPYLRFDQGGKRMVMEPDGVHIADWPWPGEANVSTQPRTNWHYRVVLTGDAIQSKGQLLATGYWKNKGGKTYTAGLLSSKDRARTWRYYSTFCTATDVLPQDQWKKGFEGPDEGSMIRLADGELMAVYRVGSGFEWKLRRSYSTDEGRTWTKPEVLPAYSVEPKLVRVANGVIALASGRPGVGLWFSTDPKAKTWQYLDVVPYHNGLFDDPSYRIMPLDPAQPEKMWQTSSYTGLVEIAKNKLLLAYDRDTERAPANANDLSRVFVLALEVSRE